MERMTLTQGYVIVGIILTTFVVYSIITNIFNIQVAPQLLQFYQKWKSVFQPKGPTKVIKRQPKWKPGLQFHHTCNLYTSCSGRSCCEKNTNYQKLHLGSGNLSMSATVQIFRRKIHNKTTVFMGDSLTSQLYMSFLDVLHLNFCQPTSHIRSKLECLFCENKQHGTGMNFNLRGLCTLGTPHCATNQGLRCMTFKKFQSIVSKSEIVLLNVGLHYHFYPEEDYAAILVKLADILQVEVLKHPGKQVIIRSTLPQHFSTKDGWYRGRRNLKQKACSNKTLHNEHWTNFYLKMTSDQYKFKYMDSAPFYTDRWDLHANPKDCTHSCLTAEITIPEMNLFNSLLD